MYDYVVVIDTEVGDSELNLLVTEPAVEVVVPGPQGPPGPAQFVVSETDPGLEEPGVWFQTFPNGDMTMWVEDGT